MAIVSPLTPRLSYLCDHCKGYIAGARLICLNCQPKQTWNTVDLCEDPECVAAVVGKEVRSDLPRPHQPTHDLLKVRQVVHDRQFGKTCREAKAALQKSRAIFERGPSSGPAPMNDVKTAKGADLAKKQKSTTAQCIVCESPVVQPCWYCVNCEGLCGRLTIEILKCILTSATCTEDTFVCVSCDSQKRDGPVGNHHVDHALVRCQPLVDEEAVISMEDRWARVEKGTMSMEDRWARVEKAVMAMENRLGRVEKATMSMEERSARVERLLECILQKMSVENA